MDSRLVILNATLFDSVNGALRPGACVTIDQDRIADVSFTSAGAGDWRVVDLAGRTLLPGLIDAHVHVTATIPDLFRLSMLPQSLITAQPLEGTQYSVEEMTAIVEEARAARTYVMAHAYSPEAITRAVCCGVRTIEHGNLLDEETAKVMAEYGAYLVPTLATYDSLSRGSTNLGWNADMLAKLEKVSRQGIDAIRIARSAGVKIGFGTDLLGEMHADQSNEFTLQAKAMPAAEVLRSATFINAEMMGQAGKLGVIAPGACADLVVVDGNPLEDLTLLQHQGKHLPLIMKAGVLLKNELAVR